MGNRIQSKVLDGNDYGTCGFTPNPVRVYLSDSIIPDEETVDANFACSDGDGSFARFGSSSQRVCRSSRRALRSKGKPPGGCSRTHSITKANRIPQPIPKQPAQSLERNTPETHQSLSTTLTKFAHWVGGMASTSFLLFLHCHRRHRHTRRPFLFKREADILTPAARVSNRIRLYSTKTFKPLGTLDYHKNGVQVLTFARNPPPREEGEAGSRPSVTPASVEEGDGVGDDDEDDEFSNSEIEARKRWLVAGGKDGRISVWELIDFAKPKP